jgi:hypothetical protein
MPPGMDVVCAVCVAGLARRRGSREYSASMRFPARCPLAALGICGLVSAVAATTLAQAPPATNQAVTDDASFAVDLTAPGVTTCFVFPEERLDADACDGVSLESVKAQVAGMGDRKNLLAVAILRQEDYETMAVVLKVPEEMPKISARDLEKTSRDILKGMSRGMHGEQTADLSVAQPARLLQLGELQVLHMRVSLRPSNKMPDLVLFMDHYFALTEGSTRAVEFMTVSTEMPAMEPVIEHVAQSLRGKPTRKRIAITAQEIGYYLGLFAVPILIGLLVVGGGVTLFITARRRKRNQTLD